MNPLGPELHLRRYRWFKGFPRLVKLEIGLNKNCDSFVTFDPSDIVTQNKQTGQMTHLSSSDKIDTS